CKVIAQGDASDPNCKALGFQEAYVRQLIDVTSGYGNVIYEVMNEPYQAACAECSDALDYWAEYWAQFVKNYLASQNLSRAISNSSLNAGYEIAEVTMATTHTANDDPDGDLLSILTDLASTVRADYLSQPAKVTAVDEMGNSDRLPGRLRKKAWTVIAS